MAAIKLSLIIIPGGRRRICYKSIEPSTAADNGAPTDILLMIWHYLNACWLPRIDSFWFQLKRAKLQWHYSPLNICRLSSSPSRPRSSREMALTEGAEERSHMPSFTRRSRISQEKMPGFSRLYSSILCSTSGDATRGLEPPMTPGRIDPVSWGGGREKYD